MSLYTSCWTFAMQPIAQSERYMAWVWKNAYELHTYFLRETKVWKIVHHWTAIMFKKGIVSFPPLSSTTVSVYPAQSQHCCRVLFVWKHQVVIITVPLQMCMGVQVQLLPAYHSNWYIASMVGLSCISLLLSTLVINRDCIIIKTYISVFWR